ncbi:Coatomer subunit zeta-1 [Hondaea fermentalgiana]|uniref:Coatomer subunit zeta n=1 Tax=Hondaea fermentalgiana TaxID=2315210 RepID=A0A2R5G148_9STRA|nr:Coatomer subunit zeta-1 [Hondaea fermentalgiana]|eukprot:GBG24730.1 Coatomer subunit zeta-1 [Hondaea fermentalgiana]
MATPSVKGVVILDSADGSRMHAKYFAKSLRDQKAQLEFERSLFQKTRGQNARSEAEIVMLDNTVVVYRAGIDVIFYVCGEPDENELILTTILDAMYEALSGILRSHLEKRTLLDNLDLVLLTVDELVDGGLILETDPVAIANRVLMKGATGETPMNELTISQALQSARDQLAKSFRN